VLVVAVTVVEAEAVLLTTTGVPNLLVLPVKVTPVMLLPETVCADVSGENDLNAAVAQSV
jgi:hypothetical protein